MTFQKVLIKTHFYLLLLVVVNLVCRITSGISLNYNIVFASKVIVYFTAIILFFTTIKPFRKLSLYFSVYAISPVLLIIIWSVNSILAALLGSLFLLFLWPPTQHFKEKNYTFYEGFSGLLGTCCNYDILENRYFIFQKNVGHVSLQGMEQDKWKSFTVADHIGYLQMQMETYKNGASCIVDTTLKIILK